MIVQPRLLIHTITAGLYCGLLVICACSDPLDPVPYQSAERRTQTWVGYYASAIDTVVVDGTPNSVQAQLELFTTPACQLYVQFSTGEPDDWAFFHSDSCLYDVRGGTVTLTLKMRVHYPGGTDLIDASATFEPVDDNWTAVIWKNIGIRLDRDVQSSG